MSTVYLILLLFTATTVNSENWGDFKKDSCTSNCQRQYSAILWNIPWGKDWTYACKNAPANINGNRFNGAKRCPQSWGRQWGEFDVPDTSCCPYWGDFKKDSCNSNCQRQYSSILWNIQSGNDWSTSCVNTPANINGIQFSGAKRCPQSGGHQWGEFDIRDTSCCPYWGDFKRDDCTYNCRRQYSSILWNIQSGNDWGTSCISTPANINGIQFSGANRCPQSGGHQWGEFDIGDTSCCPYWGSFTLDSCSQTPGRAIYSAVLYGVPRLESWESSCANFGATIGGQTVSKPTECVKTIFNMWGKFDIIYDETIVSSSTTCYAFEYEDTDDVCHEHEYDHDELRRRKKRADKCLTRGETVSYWITAIVTMIQLLRDLNDQPRTRPILPIPEPNTIQDFRGLEGISMPNSFVFDGRHAFRVLRNQNDENYRREKSSNYRTKPPEGNGLNGLSPADSNSASTIYEHVTNGQLHTRYISASSDFGRTQDLVIASVLDNYNREQTQQINERSRWFVQIDVSRLTHYELTNPDVFHRTCLPPSGGLPRRICTNVRRWSELLIEGAVPSRSIIRTFQVYAVNTTHYVLNVVDNPNYSA